MNETDLSENQDIQALLETLEDLVRARRPGEAAARLAACLAAPDSGRAWLHLATRGLAAGKYRVLRAVDAQGCDRVESCQAERLLEQAPVHDTGLLRSLVATPEPKTVHALDHPADPVLGAFFAGFGSLAAAPLFVRGAPGEWAVVLDRRPDGFAAGELAGMLVHANLSIARMRTLEQARELRAAQAYIEREVRSIAEIQRSLLPREMPRIPGVSVAASYETFDRAGGDYYSFLPLAPGRDPEDPETPWGIIVADASGHGPSAAVVVAMLHSLLHSYGREATSPAAFIEHINRNLQTERIRHAFVTAFFGILQPASRTLRYVRAGHEPPILMRPGPPAEMRRLDAVNGFPLGVCAEVGSAEAVVQLEPGQSLVLYTDGITDSFSPAGERFKVEGIERALVRCDGSPGCVVAYVRDALDEHEAGRRAHDDQTIVALRFDA